MAKYISNRQQNLKIGIVSYTEDKTVLEVTGNVGIGTTNATSKLHVVGDGYFVGVLTSTKFVGGSISGTSVVGTSLSISGISTLGVTSATNLTSQQLSISGISTLGVTSATNLTSQQLSISGISTFTNGPVLIGGGTSTGTAGQVLQVTGINSSVYIGGSVGLGTTNPTSKLFVVGDGYFTGIVTSSGFYVNGSLIGGSISGTDLVGTALSVSGISTFTNGPVLIGGGTSTGTAGQVLQVTGINSSVYIGGSVGLGTTNPTSKLFVVGDGYFTGIVTATSFSGNASSASYATNAGYSTSSGISTNLKGGSGGTVVYQSAADTTAFLANGTSGHILQSNGGTNAPSWVAAAPAAAITGLTIRDEGTIVGGANSVSTLNFVGSIVSVASNSGIATITFLDYVSNAGIATYATNAGTSTSVIGGIASVTQLYVSSGITTVGFITASSAYVTGVTTSGGVNVTTGNDYKVNNNSVLTNDTLGSGVVNSSLTSVGTLGQLNVSGITTLGVTSTTNLTSQQLNVSGISTFSNGPVLVGTGTSTGTSGQVLQVSGINSSVYIGGSVGIGTTNPTSKLWVNGDGYFTGILTANRIFSSTYGEFVGGSISGTAIVGTSLSVSGISTFTSGPILVGTGTSTGTASQPLQVTGGAYVSSSVGIGTTNPTQTLHVQGNARITGAFRDSTDSTGTSGQVLQSTVSGTQWTTAGVVIRDDGSPVGTATTIDFGANLSVSFVSGIATITGSDSTTRTTSRIIATENQTLFSVNYTVGYVDVFLNGSKLDSTEYTAINGTTVTLTEGANVNDCLEFVTFSSISLSGTTVIDDINTDAVRYIALTDATSGSISSIRVASTELTFNSGTNTFTTGNIVGTNLNVTGIATISTLIPTQTRIQDAAEKIIRIDGNTVSINYSSGGGNIGLCTNPSGNISLAVTGIPTDSSFDNHSILFSVVAIQTGIARTCTAVSLNGVSKTIKWPSGTVGSGTTNSYDIFNFIGINTIGSASTTLNYEVLGIVNGGFR